MADAGAAVIIDESMLSADVLAGQLREWLSNRQELLDKAEKAHRLDKPSALARITELCLEQAGVAA
jgi:UDP-N-acetylglucosamine:LPS N-acetylglucosamine transferase